MAYITSERVKEIRNALKKLYPSTKFSVIREHYSGVRIAIMESDTNFTEGYESVNEFCISNTYEGIQRDMLLNIYSIASEGTTYYETGDYGRQPSHYVWMSIGRYDKHFKRK